MPKTLLGVWKFEEFRHHFSACVNITFWNCLAQITDSGLVAVITNMILPGEWSLFHSASSTLFRFPLIFLKEKTSLSSFPCGEIANPCQAIFLCLICELKCLLSGILSVLYTHAQLIKWVLINFCYWALVILSQLKIVHWSLNFQFLCVNLLHECLPIGLFILELELFLGLDRTTSWRPNESHLVAFWIHFVLLLPWIIFLHENYVLANFTSCSSISHSLLFFLFSVFLSFLWMHCPG